MDTSDWTGAATEWAEGFTPPERGPRLFAAPGEEAEWLRAVRRKFAAHPGLRAELEAQAEPRPVRATPSGWVEPRQWTACLPAAALLALVDGSPAGLERVRGRAPAVLGLDDWVPPHHAHSRPLDLSAAGVIGHLALYLDLARDLMPADERRAVAAAIAERGVHTFAAMCDARRAPWTTARHNWATVVAGEVGMGCLAAWEAVRDPAGALARIVERIAAPLSTYPPDGSYEEGPGYWHYGVGECLPVCLALWLASGGRVDLFTLPFLQHTGDYALHVRTPDGGCFQVEDGNPRWAAGWMLGILGRRFGQAAWTAVAAAAAGTPAGGPALRQALYGGATGAPTPPAVPTMAFFPGTQNAMLRSDWGGRAFCAGLHAGSNTVNHAHLDLGTFSVWAAGERVLADAGSWAYAADYFQRTPGGRRWDYEPNTTAGHNAVLVDGAGQEPAEGAHCRFQQVDLDPEGGLALLAVDLSAAYGGRLRRLVRHFAYFAEGVLVVADDAAAPSPCAFAWCAHPAAPAEALADGPGWRWQTAGAAAELRLLGLSPGDGFTLSEQRRRTSYLDRVGHPLTYETHALRAETLHRTDAWSVAAVLVAGPAGALPAVAAESGGPAALRLDLPGRRGSLAWADGRMTWTPA